MSRCQFHVLIFSFLQFIVVRDEDWLDAEEARVRREFRMSNKGDGQGMRGRYVIPAKRQMCKHRVHFCMPKQGGWQKEKRLASQVSVAPFCSVSVSQISRLLYSGVFRMPKQEERTCGKTRKSPSHRNVWPGALLSLRSVPVVLSYVLCACACWMFYVPSVS